MWIPSEVLLSTALALSGPNPATLLALTATGTSASTPTKNDIRILDATRPATAVISASCRFTMARVISGFVVESSGALLTTVSAFCDKGNTHINFSGGAFQELTPRGQHEISVRGVDGKLDLVLLQVTAPHDAFPFLRLADSDHVKPGDRWLFHERRNLQPMTTGTIPRTESIEGIGVWRLKLPDADEGQPLLDERGDVIGIVVQSDTHTAIVLPINAAKPLLSSHESLSPYEALVMLGSPTYGDGVDEFSDDATATRLDRDLYRVVVKSDYYGKAHRTYRIQTLDCGLSGKGNRAVLTLYASERRAERFPKKLAPVVGHLFFPGGFCYIRSNKEE
jgi:hypothetical protein